MAEKDNCPYCGHKLSTRQYEQSYYRIKRTLSQMLEAETIRRLRAELEVRLQKDQGYWLNTKVKRQTERIKQLEKLLQDNNILVKRNSIHQSHQHSSSKQPPEHST